MVRNHIGHIVFLFFKIDHHLPSLANVVKLFPSYVLRLGFDLFLVMRTRNDLWNLRSYKIFFEFSYDIRDLLSNSFCFFMVRDLILFPIRFIWSNIHQLCFPGQKNITKRFLIFNFLYFLVAWTIVYHTYFQKIDITLRFSEPIAIRNS